MIYSFFINEGWILMFVKHCTRALTVRVVEKTVNAPDFRSLNRTKQACLKKI